MNAPAPFLTTSEAAAALGIQVKTMYVIRSLNKDGNYRGIHPVKRANGRLLWPAAAIHALKAKG